MASPEPITNLLASLGSGDLQAAHALMPLVYAELRGVARAALQGQSPGHTLQATELVHEAYLRLLGNTAVPWQNRAHFFAVAARAMRQILVDHARAKRSKKRGGAGQKESLLTIASPSGPSHLDLLALEEALGALAEHDSRKARVVELRFFGGLTREQIAEVLAVTTRTVERDWRYSQAWLSRRLDPIGDSEPESENRDG